MTASTKSNLPGYTKEYIGEMSMHHAQCLYHLLKRYEKHLNKKDREILDMLTDQFFEWGIQ